MNQKILDTNVQNYINANLHSDLHSLLLKKSPFDGVSMLEIIQQIKGKQVAEKKFPFLLKEGIVFPVQLSLEQSSSEKTAEYKSKLLKGRKFLDITSGFGIDAFYLSQNFDDVSLIEQNSELLDIVEHNWSVLNRKATFYNNQLETILDQLPADFDVIYLDPARRDQNKNKVFLLEDLSPNILDIQDQLLEKSQKVIIKLSPLIDLKYLVSVLKSVSRIDIIAVKNDVKEVVVFLERDFGGNIECYCSNLETDEGVFTYYFGDEMDSQAEFSEPEQYIYLPNNAILKAGVFNLIATQFQLKKLHPNSHIYTSNALKTDFPGRVLNMELIESKSIKKNEKYNIIAKNYPLKPEDLKKKYKLKDGGNNYLIFTQSKKGKIILKSI